MRYIYSFVFLFFFLTNAVFPAYIDKEGRYTQNIRPGKPASISHSARPEYITKSYTWHHMVPWNKLYRFWNSLIDRLHSQKIVQGDSDEYDRLVKTYIETINVSDPGDIFLAIKSKNLTAPQAEALEKCVCWASWNLVEGPKEEYRTDDPSDNFDNFKDIVPVVGDKVKLLNTAIDNFIKIDSNMTIDKTRIKPLYDIINGIKQNTRGMANAYLFDKSWWSIDGINKSDVTEFCWRKKTSPPNPPVSGATCAKKKTGKYNYITLKMTVDAGNSNAVFFTGTPSELTGNGTGIQGLWNNGNIWEVTIVEPTPKQFKWSVMKGKAYDKGAIGERGNPHDETNLNPGFQGW